MTVPSWPWLYLFTEQGSRAFLCSRRGGDARVSKINLHATSGTDREPAPSQVPLLPTHPVALLHSKGNQVHTEKAAGQGSPCLIISSNSPQPQWRRGWGGEDRGMRKGRLKEQWRKRTPASRPCSHRFSASAPRFPEGDQGVGRTNPDMQALCREAQSGWPQTCQ